MEIDQSDNAHGEGNKPNKLVILHYKAYKDYVRSKNFEMKLTNLKILICLYNIDRYCVKKLGRSAVNKAPNGAV